MRLVVTPRAKRYHLFNTSGNSTSGNSLTHEEKEMILWKNLERLLGV